MTALQILLNERFVIKSKNVERFLMVKDGLKECKKFIEEKLGYTIVLQPNFIKLEKIPGLAEAWMGIEDFTTIREYQMLCYLLIFLEDKEIEQQFVLSEITEFLSLQFTSDELKWTDFPTRKQLVRVIKYVLDVGLIKQNDGDENGFARDEEAEVLYENTGISKYFLRYFGIDIMGFDSPADFDSTTWGNLDEDRGIVRRQRIYRRLLLSPGVYRDDEQNEDFAYIRNQRSQIEQDFQKFLACDLHVHRSSAYLVLDDMKSLGRTFPRGNAADDLVLFLFTHLRKMIKTPPTLVGEQTIVSVEEFEFHLLHGIKSIRLFLPKTQQAKSDLILTQEVIARMIHNGFIKRNEDNIIIYPIVGKLTAYYKDTEGDAHEQK